jgi:hypothetical protein
MHEMVTKALRSCAVPLGRQAHMQGRPMLWVPK